MAVAGVEVILSGDLILVCRVEEKGRKGGVGRIKSAAKERECLLVRCVHKP